MYKVIIKVVIDRLKSIMPKVVLPNQVSFIPRRYITDNIIIAQEIAHSMKNKKGKKSWMALKIDLEKAYDRIRWNFIEDTLLDIGLSGNLIGVIIRCFQNSMF